MKFKFFLFVFFGIFIQISIYSQDKLFFNRIHYFEHQDCEHPIGTVIFNKVFFSNNTDASAFMNINNLENEVVYVDLINYKEYTAFNQYLKNDFLSANTLMMGFRENVPNFSESMKEARSRFRLGKVKDTIIDKNRMKHIRIEPKDTLAYRFKSYHILVNTNTKTETPLYTSPTVYFLLPDNLKEMKGTVVETYFIDLQGYRFCRDIIKGFEVTNKRVIIK